MALSRPSRWLAGLGVLAALFAGFGVYADLYRCAGEEGRARYVDDPHACPSATPYQPRRRVQSVGPSTGSAAPPQRTPTSRFNRNSSTGFGEQDAAFFWQRKKTQAQSELQRVDALLPRLERMAWRCNKGADAWYTDRAGLKHGVSCPQIGAERDRARAERERLRRYLEVDLAEECRRAGCLPGWVR